jgi:hypothetical protein
MAGNSKKIALFLIFTVWLTLSCRLTDDLGLTGSTPTITGAVSTFVPHQEKLVVDLGEQVIIETYHMSANRLGSLEIFVNRQSAADIGSTIDTTLASVDLATLKVLAPSTEYAGGECISDSCDELSATIVSMSDQPIAVPPIQSEYPNTTWSVFLLWTGYVPGTYDLTMHVTDNAGIQSDPITQRIEVKEATP